MKKIIAFGEIVWDLVEGQSYLGGAPLNFAFHVTQCGASAGIISCVGNDNLGRDVLERLGHSKLDLSMVQQIEGKSTGTVRVRLEKGEPSYDIVNDVAYDHISKKILKRGIIESADAFYFGSLAQRSKVSRSCLNHILENYAFETIFCDINLREGQYSREIILNSFTRTNILKMNFQEYCILSQLLYAKSITFKEFTERLCADFQNVQIIIMTLGNEGCRVFAEGTILDCPTTSVEVIDTVGAGDAFSAAFLLSYQESKNIEESARFANKIGGIVASLPGAMPSF